MKNGVATLLTVLIENQNPTLMEQPKRHTMLPFLVVLFLISYGLLTMLVVEQDRTIGSQRTLIQQLFTDSLELTNIKMKAVEHGQTAAHPGARAKTPSSQVNPQDNATGKGQTQKFKKAVPVKPPKDASDSADERRNLISI